MLLPFPGGFTNVCFSNSLTLLWRHNYRIEISFVAQEICKRMFDLLSATNRKWLVWQEVACSGMSVSSHLRTTHAQQHRWLYNEVTLWNPTNEKRPDPNLEVSVGIPFPPFQTICAFISGSSHWVMTSFWRSEATEHFDRQHVLSFG